ncbi:MAG: type III pantothenate kinase [Lysobacterales bacterium]|nr:MAG: type III pantothenate kinase [Xanthomonadales bacterium]
MTLLVDIGNSRVKWARLQGNEVLGEQQAAVHERWSAEDWLHTLFAGDPVERVVAATVAGSAGAAALDAAARRATGRGVEFATTERECAGVVNGYADPALLGIDRWLAVIAAWHHVRDACVVVDVGTAATVDVVAADGRHCGGYIVPGPSLMVGVLLRGTSDLAARHSGSGATRQAPFADNTRDAIERGCRVALAALVDRSLEDARSLCGGSPALLVTGGAAASVALHVRSQIEMIPDLVLRGLARWAAARRT